MEKVTGVYWNTGSGKWVAQIQIEKKRIYLGSFDSRSSAIKARKDAEVKNGIKKVQIYNDLDGQKIGKLTVVGDTGKRDSAGNKILLCKHEDGSFVEFNKYSLTTGEVNGVGSKNAKPVGKTGERYITFEKGKYLIRKKVGGKQKYFGTFNTLPEAITKRDEILQQLEQGKL